MISYYELLGMIKEGTNPEQVKIDNIVYEWNDNNYLSVDEALDYLNADIDEIKMFDKIIEIIEEDKNIEEIIIGENTATSYMTEQIRTDINVLADKINELIKEVNKLRKD